MMREKDGPGVAAWVLTATVMMLAACALPDKPRSARGGAMASVPSARMSEPVWRLRVGLNVAALTCRGRSRVPVTGPYRAVLTRHRALLASAYQEELQRIGTNHFDRAQTRLYNRFANQRSPERFCRGAQRLARRAASMNSRDLAPAARGMAAELEAQLR